MVTLSIVAMFGMCGLVVDLGYANFVARTAQTAADSSALAATEAALSAASGPITCSTSGILCNASPTRCASSPAFPPANNIDNGCLYAKQNGFTAAGNQNVTMQSGVGPNVPTAVGIASAQYWATARVSQQIPQLFSAILGNTSLTLTKRASAAIIPAYSGDCIYILEPNGSNAFVVSGSGSVTAPCGIHVDSSDSKAMQVTGGACVTASVIDVVGGDSGSNSCIHPAPTTGQAPFSDPLGGLKEPAFPATCDHTTTVISNTTATLNPGVYCGGITVSGSSNVTFNPGLYTLVGGGLNASSSGSTITGSGVTFYNTGCGSGLPHTTCPSAGSGSYNGSYKPYVLSGGVHGTLSAPTSGPYNNLLLMQDRTLPIQSSQETISGGSSAQFTGVVYLPRSPMVYSGGSSTNSPSMGIVAWTLTVSGNSYLKNGLNGNGGGTGAMVALVE